MCLISAMVNIFYVSQKQDSWHIKLIPVSEGISEQHCYTLLNVLLNQHLSLNYKRPCQAEENNRVFQLKKKLKIYLKLYTELLNQVWFTVCKSNRV